MASQERTGATVTVEGDSKVTLADTPAARDRFGWRTREFVIDCHSGRTIDGSWSGFPVAPLTEAAAFPADTTHLLVTARDGYRVCVGIRLALDGLVGFVCEDVTVTGGDSDSALRETPRFLAEGVDSSRTARDVEAIEAVTLRPDEDPHDYEIVE
jgi:hypothetical protein